MSDPAKSVNEIEDVLASIRRLVSETHGGPAHGGPAHGGSAAAEPARLVLTPAHRVSEPDDPWAPVPAAEPATSADADDPAWGLEDRLSDWGEIEDSAEESVADAIAEQAMDAPPRPAQAPAAARGDDNLMTPDEAPAFTEFESETGDADWPQQGAPVALRQLALVRGQAQPEADVATQPEAPSAEDPPSETPSVEAAVDAAPETPTAAAETAASPSAPPAGDDAALAAPEDDPDSTVEGAPRVFSRRVEVRRPMAEAAGTPDPAPEAASADADEIEDLGEDGPMFTFPETEDGLLDEATLREIIAEVVREELQGALGQRITRNVRKMVRREIRLALAAQDLE